MRKNFSLATRSPSFWHAPILLPVRGLLGNRLDKRALGFVVVEGDRFITLLSQVGLEYELKVFWMSWNCYHHHHVVPLAQISLTLSRHFSQSFIASDRSSGLHPVSSHSCCMYVRAGRHAFAWPYAGVHRSTLMSSSLLLQQCPACLVRLTCIVFVMGGRWPYSWCLVGCCHQDLFNIARSILA